MVAVAVIIIIMAEEVLAGMEVIKVHRILTVIIMVQEWIPATISAVMVTMVAVAPVVAVVEMIRVAEQIGNNVYIQNKEG